MATGLEMMMANIAPLLQKMIPPEVWSAVVDRVTTMAQKVVAIDDRLAAIEANQRAILLRLGAVPDHDLPGLTARETDFITIDHKIGEPHGPTNPPAPNGHQEPGSSLARDGA